MDFSSHVDVTLMSEAGSSSSDDERDPLGLRNEWGLDRDDPSSAAAAAPSSHHHGNNRTPTRLAPSSSSASLASSVSDVARNNVKITLDDLEQLDDDAEFVLQYSTIGGQRQRQDDVVAQYALHQVTKNIVADLASALWVGASVARRRVAIRRVTQVVLSVLFALPCIWCIINATVLDDAMPEQLPIDGCRFAYLIRTVRLSVADAARINNSALANLKAADGEGALMTAAGATSTLLNVSQCVACNDGRTRVSRTTAPGGGARAVYLSSAVRWDPYGFAVCCNVFFSLLCVATYHRLELRRRVAAHMLSFGTICTNRWTLKRVAGVVAFLVLFFVTCVATFGPRLSQSVVVDSASSTSFPLSSSWSSSDSVVPLAQARTLEAVADSDAAAVALLFGSAQTAAATATIDARCAGYSVALPDSANSTTVSVRLIGLAAAFDAASISRDVLLPGAAEPSSFLSFIREVFAAALPYLPVLYVLWRRLDCVFPLHSLFLATAMDHGHFNTLRYVAGTLRFHCELDVVLKAVALLAKSSSHAATSPSSITANVISAPCDSAAATAGGNDDDADGAVSPARDDLDPAGMTVSWLLALTQRSGWLSVPPSRGRWTTDAHPHELLFGTTWGAGEEEANAVLSILFEHACLRELPPHLHHHHRRGKTHVDAAARRDVAAKREAMMASI